MSDPPKSQELHPALQRFVEQFKPIGEALIDSYFIVDHERNIVDFNHNFYSMLPRSSARGLKGRKCHEVLELEICRDRCIAQQCWRDRQQLRLDEISGRAVQTDAPQRFIVLGVPIYDEGGAAVGALEIQRNVTDEANVQVKYQEMLELEAREKQRLMRQIQTLTKELMDTNAELSRTRKELVNIRKGLFI
jgi:PAS domain-containing protein